MFSIDLKNVDIVAYANTVYLKGYYKLIDLACDNSNDNSDSYKVTFNTESRLFEICYSSIYQ